MRRAEPRARAARRRAVVGSRRRGRGSGLKLGQCGHGATFADTSGRPRHRYDQLSMEIGPQEVDPLVTGGSTDYSQPVPNVPEPSSGLCGIICRSLCCAKKNSSHDAPGRTFPRNPAEFQASGVAWANAVMADRLGGNKVTRVEVGGLGAQGLLSELCMATLTYQTEQADLPKEVVVKFAPAELKTQLTMNIFLLCKAEYLAYTQFNRTLPRQIRTPVCYGADFNYTVRERHNACVRAPACVASLGQGTNLGHLRLVALTPCSACAVEQGLHDDREGGRDLPRSNRARGR